MSKKPVPVFLDTEKPAKIKKWKVKEGMLVSSRQVICIYSSGSSDSTGMQYKFKSNQVGTVKRIIAKEGDIIPPGGCLLELEECSHSTVMKDMCAECGADLRKNERISTNASVPMVHSIPELKVSEEQAQIIGKADENRLISDRKLVLLVDLDQTLIHTTNDNIPPNLKDVYHFRLYGHLSPWYHTRIRPRTREFLEEVAKYYELHICTFGARNYAHTIAMFLDPDGKFFSHRILSRDECFSANSKTANLKALFPCGDHMVCIIDDREDVWNYAANLIHVKPYHFFKHTGDINAPPGLAKNENDEIDGFDFGNLDTTAKEEASEPPPPAPEEPVQKKVASPSSNSRSQIEPLGESTTDKDTEDDEEKSTKGKVHGEEGGKGDVEKVTGDLQLSEDDSDDETKKGKGTVGEVKDTRKGGGEEEVEEERGKEMKVEEKGKEAMEVDKGNEVMEEEGRKKEKMEENRGKEVVKGGRRKEVVEEERGKKAVVEERGKNVLEEGRKKQTVEGDRKMEAVVEDRGRIEVEKEKGKEIMEEGRRKETMEEDRRKEKVEEDRRKEEVTEEKGKKEETDDLIEVEDSDDYLMYLEDILKNIHKSYYEEYDKKKEESGIPDLKEVIPNVKKQVLKGCHLVFSGLVPSHIPLEQSRAYMVAISLGATVSADISPGCTHLVAARPGTAKVNSSRRQKGIVIVTPLWLWHCAERWERLDERMYSLGRSGLANRVPPAHCGSPEHNAKTEDYCPALRNRTPSGRFIDTINPLLTFSSEDMKMMDQEVEDLFNEEDDDEEDTESEQEKKRAAAGKSMGGESSTSSSEDSLSGASHPKGWSERKGRKRKAEGTTTCSETEYDEESPSVKFRRGEPLPSDLDLGEESQDVPDEEAMDDGEWNMMGAALEREFLSGE